MENCIGYLTAKNKDQALVLAKALLEKRLIACANIFAGVDSVYRWEGKVEVAEEAVLVVKTNQDLQSQIITVVKALHSYEIPCVVFYPLTAGNPDYLKWVNEQTQKA
jgi:periplasmic divalent cation tolerance protein